MLDEHSNVAVQRLPLAQSASSPLYRHAPPAHSACTHTPAGPEWQSLARVHSVGPQSSALSGEQYGSTHAPPLQEVSPGEPIGGHTTPLQLCEMTVVIDTAPETCTAVTRCAITARCSPSSETRTQCVPSAKSFCSSTRMPAR